MAPSWRQPDAASQNEPLSSSCRASSPRSRALKYAAITAERVSVEGGAGSAGTALKASGPSGSYGGRVSAIVKPNIVFTENPQDNPTALVEVRAAPDGTIVARKLVKSSGNKAWDEAVLKAIDKTAVLPRDIDGTVPPVLEINFRRRD